MRKIAMKQLLLILTFSLLFIWNIRFIQAESIDPYIDALSIEAEQTSMKANKAAVLTDQGPEPPVVPTASDDIDMLSREVSERLKIILTDSLTEEAKQKKLAKIISNAVKKGHEISSIQNAVSEAMAELSKRKHLDIKQEALEFAEKTVNEIVEASKDITQGDPNDPYIKSLNAEVNGLAVEDENSNIKERPEASTGIQALIKRKNRFSGIKKAEALKNTAKSATRTIVVLKGESLSGIAYKVYGAYDKYLFLYEVNRDLLDSPDLIMPGQILKIPLLRI